MARTMYFMFSRHGLVSNRIMNAPVFLETHGFLYLAFSLLGRDTWAKYDFIFLFLVYEIEEQVS